MEEARFALRAAARQYAARYLRDLCMTAEPTSEEEALQAAALVYAAEKQKEMRRGK